jgi:DNA polymerase-4
VLGIYSLMDLKNFNADNIRRALGRYGYYLWANVNGIEVNKVSSGTPAPKSIGHSYCLPKKTTDKKYLSSVFYKLCEKTGRRLRNQNLEAEHINIYLAYVREGGAGRSFKTPEKMFTTEEIFNYINDFLERTELLMPVSMLAVSVGRLAPASPQMSLFEDNLSRQELSRAIDKLNDKYGEYTVIRGRMFGTADMARDRIGFRKVELGIGK